MSPSLVIVMLTSRFEQDRTWLMLGMAIRMATDLNLHRKSATSGLDTEDGRSRDLEVGRKRLKRCRS